MIYKINTDINYQDCKFIILRGVTCSARTAIITDNNDNKRRTGNVYIGLYNIYIQEVHK